MKKILILLIIIILGIGAFAVIYYVISETEKPEEKEQEKICQDLCGDGICQEIVCLGTGCPCSETEETCSVDCAK